MTPRELNLGWLTQVEFSWYGKKWLFWKEVFLHPEEVTEVEEKTRIDYPGR